MDIDAQIQSLTKIVSQQAKTTAEQGEQISSLAARATSIENTLKEVGVALKELAQNVHKPINITAWISISISAVVLAAVYLEARFDPVEKLAERAVTWTDTRDALLQEDYVLWGAQGAKLEHNFERVHELSEEIDSVGERVATIEGAWPLLIKQIDAIDLLRSRGWNSAVIEKVKATAP